MAGVMAGSIRGTGIDRSVAKEFVHKTPAKKRRMFAKNLRNKKEKK